MDCGRALSSTARSHFPSTSRRRAPSTHARAAIPSPKDARWTSQARRSTGFAPTTRANPAGHRTPRSSNGTAFFCSAAHPDCRGLWFVKRQAVPDQQLNDRRPGYTRTQPPRCPVTSKPNGLRLLQGACEPSRSMFPRRARATRARGVPPPFRASKGSALARSRSRSRGRAQACSVVGRAVECGEESRGERCHAQTTQSTDGAAAADKSRDALPAPVYVRLPLLTRLAFLLLTSPIVKSPACMPGRV